MPAQPADPESHSKLDLIESIANPVRRSAMLELQRRTGRVDVKELATLTAATTTGQELVDVSRGERDTVHWRLVHTHLQKLVEGGLVAWDDEAGTARVTDHPALEDDRFRNLLRVDDEGWDDVLTALQSERRRVAVTLLAEAEALDRQTLARRVAAAERGIALSAVSPQDVDDVRVSLHHVHLPLLADADLVDVDSETVRYDGHPDLEPEWVTVASDLLDRRSEDDADADEDDRSDARLVEVAGPALGSARSASSSTSPNSS